MKKKLYYFLILLIFLLDQVSKFFVMKFINVGESITVINNFFSLTASKNYGAAYGIFSNKQLFIIVISFIILSYLIYEFLRCKNRFGLLSISFIIGGLFGNLSDRIFLGYVRDFLDFNLFGYDAAIFNVSDSFIVVGTFLFIIYLFMEESNGSKRKCE